MEKINFGSLVIEVTRKCNMKCQHCLRGPARNIDMDSKYIDILLNKTNYIDNLAFSGGEPSLNVDMIDYFIEGCKKRKIGIGMFFIATNTKVVTEKFLMTIIKLYAYCEYKEMCSIGISNDQFHDINKNNVELLSAFKFTSKRTKNDHTPLDYMINEGNFKKNYNMGSTRSLVSITIEDEDDGERKIESSIYLNCLGKIINGCDWSYVSQNQSDKIICDVNDLSYDVINKYNKKLTYHD